MAHQKKDRLWKFEDQLVKLEIYVSDYDSVKLDQLRCDVLAKTRHFSGEYQASLGWSEILQFGAECERLAGLIEKSDEGAAARFCEGETSRLSIKVEPAGANKVRWELMCRPVRFHIEDLRLSVTTSYELLNSISSGAARLWSHWPGPKALARQVNKGR